MGFSRKLTLQCSNPACTYTNNMHTSPRAEGRKHVYTINGLVSSTATVWQDPQVRTSNALELQRRMREGVVARLKFLDYSSATVIFTYRIQISATYLQSGYSVEPTEPNFAQ